MYILRGMIPFVIYGHIYETRVKVSLLKNIRAFNFRTDGSVRN